MDVYDRVHKLGSQMQASGVNCGIMCCEAHTGSPLGKVLFGESLKIAKKMGEDAKYVHSGCLEILMTKEECEWGRASVEF